MTRGRFAEEFKAETIRQVFEWGYSVAAIAKRLGYILEEVWRKQGWGLLKTVASPLSGRE